MKQSVLHVLGSLDFGGVETRMQNISAKRFVSRFDQRFVAIKSGGRAATTITESGASVTILGVSPTIPSISAISALLSLMQRDEPTVVHTHGAEANFHGLIAAKIAGIRVRIGEEIGIPGHSWKARMVFRQVYRCAHKVVGVSDAVSQWLVDSTEIPTQKSTTILTGIDIPPPQMPIFRDDNSIHILYVGRLHPIKNPLGLLKAVLLLRQRGVLARVTFIGDGPQRAQCEAMVENLGLSAEVSFLGFIESPFNQSWKVNLVVQPSLSEGTSLSLMEAMACTLPVITTEVGGSSKVIDEGRTGWLMDTSSPEAIGARINEVWSMGPEKLIAAGLEARASICQKFSLDAYIQRLDDVYDNVLANFEPKKINKIIG